METAAARLDAWDPDSPGEALREFARGALARLAPKLATEALVTDEASEAPYDFTQRRRRWGTAAAGFELIERAEIYEGGGWMGERRSTSVVTYGLPGGAELRLSHFGTNGTCQVTAPAPLASRIAAEFESAFNAPPGRALLDSLAQAAHAALARGSWDEAIANGHAVLKHRPRDADALLAVGAGSAASGDLDLAQLALEELIAAHPSHVDGRYNLAKLFFERQDWPAALAHFQAALAADPANHPCHFQRARTLERLDRPGEALAAYRRAVETSPNPGGAWGYRGMDFTQEAEQAVRRLGG